VIVERDDDVLLQQPLDAALPLFGHGVDVGLDAADLLGQFEGFIVHARFQVLEGLVAIVGLLFHVGGLLNGWFSKCWAGDGR
jgi:hypothetical protein